MAVPGPRPPAAPCEMAPPRSCDCHAHVFDGISALSADRIYDPPEARLAAFEAMLAALGLERGVIVQPSVYGIDNRSTLRALASNPARFRGVVVVSADADPAELARLDDLGVRGVRVNRVFRGGPDGLTDLAHRIAPLGWHLQVLCDVSATPEIPEMAEALPVPLVFDHMGHVPAAATIHNPGFQALLRAVVDGHAWVKLSGAYRMTARPAPPYHDVRPFAQALVTANPERCVWASDWPHPSISVDMPEDGTLFDMFTDWVPDPEVRRRILVDNPAVLYGFPQGDKGDGPFSG